MKYAFVFLLLISLTSVGQVKSDSTASADTLKPVPVSYLKRQPYQIVIPRGWRVSNDCIDKNCSLLSPSDTLGSPDRFIENINIVFDNLSSKNYTVDQYAQYSISYLPKVVKGFKVHEKKKLKPNVYMVIYSGEKSNFAQKWKQYYYVKNQKVYVVTFAAETSKFEYYLPFVNDSLASFKIF